jgi:[DsrC]-trisulfide reductase subunit J
MKRFSNSIIGALGVAFLAMLPVSAQAGGRVPLPVIAQGKGDHCVEPTDFMRRNHMELLKHHRDETMHRGIRTKKYSLQECIDCHAGKTSGSVIGDDNFCQSCHNYTATHLDCWDCHASKPKKAVLPANASALMGGGEMR